MLNHPNQAKSGLEKIRDTYRFYETFREKLPSISFIVRTKGNKLDGVVKAVRTICTKNNGIISLFSAH